MKLSVLILTKNEENMIRGCLESVQWADEIIVLDSFSTDRTIEICKEYTDKIFQHEFKDFSEQRKKILEYPENDWCLKLDADERVTKKLALDIIDKINNPGDNAGFECRFRQILLGKWLEWGKWYYETYLLRLFRKSCVDYADNIIHELIQINGKISRLKYDIYHLSHRNMKHILDKNNFYTTLEAKQMFDSKTQQEKIGVFKLLKESFAHFYDIYIRNRGYRDGLIGFIESINQSYYTFAKLVKFYELNHPEIEEFYRDFDKNHEYLKEKP